MDFTPRPAQIEVLKYTHGSMGISAVPGSGKTHTLSALAAQLILQHRLKPNEEILIVTLTNSAVDNFSSRINAFLDTQTRRPLILPFRVRTLHGLAHDIVRERPDLVSLDSNFQIIDEREADSIRNDAALAWLRSHSQALDDYLDPNLEENRINWITREPLPNLLISIATAYIRTAKDMQVTPDVLKAQLERLPLPLPLAEMGAAIYADYQRALAYRGAVDFDDLIRLALQALEADPEFLRRLQNRWPYILEDEAQDSSRLQERILRSVVGTDGNWVRVGDPNQAIFESFTTASPKYLRNFMQEADYALDLPNSGRSTQSIINLANELIAWTREGHPTPEVRDALDEPYILPTPEGDPQPNPPDQPEQIYLISKKYSSAGELEAIVNSIERWLPENPDKTIAVLVPRNDRGFALRDLLAAREIPTHDGLLRASSTTRFAAGALGNILRYLGDPQSARKLATVYQVWRRADREDADLWAQAEEISQMIAQIPRVEDFIWPRGGSDWLDSLDLAATNPEFQESLLAFRERVQIWQGAVLLPVDQIILTLSQDLFSEPTELAIAHKLAVLLRQAENTHADWRLPELAGELAVIAKNERRFLGFSPDDTGFDPDAHKGEVVISTVHKAKGLEWDRVYLMSVNSYNFPSGDAYDTYLPEKWFVREHLNLEAETLAQLDAAFSVNEYDWYQEGQATHAARMEYVRERLRLFYVGITRARQELVITWNTGRRDNATQAIPFVALEAAWNSRG
ncbi:MAG TPA: ATP-dependent helicase [Chloroflexi bacterium]|nr:ATP-dependent helicase [Chloroflexota bacterium]